MVGAGGLSRWQRRDTAALFAVLLLAALARLGFAFRAPLFVVNDSLSYVLPAWELLHGEGFSPIYKRPPLYPLFVAKVLWLFGEDPQAIAVTQHVMGIGVVALAFMLGFLLAGSIGASVAGALTASSSPLILTEHYLMSETLYGFLLTLTVISFILTERSGSIRLAAVTGALLALSALTRPIAQLVLPMVVIWIAWRYWEDRRRAVLLGSAVCMTYIAIVSPWMLRNLAVQGSFTVAGGMGEGIAVRTIRYEQRFDFRSSDPAEPEPMRQARRIYRDEASDGSAFQLAARLRDELRVSPATADTLMRQIAFQAIRQQPMYYLTGSAEMFWKVLTGRTARLRQDWTPWRGMVWDSRIPHLLPRATSLQNTEFAAAEWVSSLYDPAKAWPVLLPLALAGVLITSGSSGRGLPWLLAILTLGQIAAAAALVGIEWRYRYPLDPVINALVGAGLAGVLGLMRRHLGHRVRPIRLS
ncbi:MAG: ArnT family glycosyltransferase [Chloroflexota bacterium]